MKSSSSVKTKELPTKCLISKINTKVFFERHFRFVFTPGNV